MHKFTIFLGICVASAVGSRLSVPDKEDKKIIGCYYIITLEDDLGMRVGDIDVSLCTHLFYSRLALEANASVESYDPYSDIEHNGYEMVNALRKKNPHLKTLLAMEDWQDTNGKNINNIEIMTNPTLQGRLIDNIVKYVKKYGFNGIDLNLTNPPKRGGCPSLKENLVEFLEALKKKMEEEHLILSATVSPDEATAEKLYDIKEMSKHLDFINLRAFDFHKSSNAEKKYGIGHSSPLYPSSKENAADRKKNIDCAVKYWIAQGAPLNKLILGIPFSGISYKLANPKKIGRGAPFTGEGHYSYQTDYCHVCETAKGWKRLYDEEQQVPYIYQGDQMIAYEDIESIRKKAEFSVKMKLGGVMVWTINYDDSYGACGEKLPLLKALNQVLGKKK